MFSAVVLTKNEEKNIIDCLEMLFFCDEIIVVDDYSEDRTVEVIKKYIKDQKIKVFKRHLDDDFAEQRNYGLEKAHGEWVLFVDADERVTEVLASEVLSIKYQVLSDCDGFYIKRKDYMWGRELKHGETGGAKFIRLARRSEGKWEGRVHEKWRIRGVVGSLENPLFHYPHQTITKFLQEVNFYTDIRVQELFMQGIQVYWASIIFYPLGKFLLGYFLKLGFLDGIPGFLMAMMMSFHSFLVRGKLWLLWQKNL